MIPQGEYGAGPVIVWDYGVYENRTIKHGVPHSVEDGAELGHVTVYLEGLKLKGVFNLVKFKDEGGKEHWLFSKSRDEHAKEGEPTWDEKSVLTDRTLDDVLGGARRPTRGSSKWVPKSAAKRGPS